MKKLFFLFLIMFCSSTILYSQGRTSIIGMSGGIAKYNSAYLTKEGSWGYNGNVGLQRYINERVFFLNQMSLIGRTGDSWTDKLQEDEVRLNFDRMEFFLGVGIGYDFVKFDKNTAYLQFAAGPNISNVFGTIEKLKSSSESSDILTRVDIDASLTWQMQYELGYKYQIANDWQIGLAYIGNLVGESMNAYVHNKTKKGDNNLHISGLNIKVGYCF